VGRATVAVRAVGGVEGLQVERLDRLDHKPGEVVLIQPVAQVRRQQQGLISVAAKEVLSHARIVFGAPDEKGAQQGGLRDTLTRLRKQSPYPRGHLPFVRREHVIGAAVGSCSRRRSRPPGIRADEGSPRGGRHLFVSDDERVAGVNA
jgi:hypothetical protein